MRAAAHLQAAGQDAFGGDAALHAGLHGLPDLRDALSHARLERRLARGRIGSALTLAFVSQHHAVDGERVAAGDVKKLGGAVKGKRQLRLGRARWRIGRALLGDETAAERKEGALRERRAVGVEGGEAETVGMRCAGAGRKHLVAMEEEIARLVEGDDVPARECDVPRGTDGGDGGRNGGGIDRCGFVAGEAKENGAIRGVAHAGESQRAVEIGCDARRAFEQAVAIQLPRKAAGRAHRPHGVRA